MPAGKFTRGNDRLAGALKDPATAGRVGSIRQRMVEAEGSTIRWFGEDWNAPVTELSPPVPVPVGEHCLECREAILEHDTGVRLPYLGGPETFAFYHRRCFFSAIGLV